MTEKSTTLIMPDYMRSFQCLAQKCEENCCLSDWVVSIDKPSYKKYNEVRLPELKPLFNRFIKRNRSNVSESHYAQIVFNHGRCPFLNPESWCSIQKQLGESYLPATCYHFPRILNAVGDTIELSASLACPETARLALLNPDGIGFSHLEANQNDFNKTGLNRSSVPDHLVDLLWELRTFSMQLLKSRDLPLWERLIILCLFFEQADRLFKENYRERIPALIRSFLDEIMQNRFHASLQKIPIRTDIQMILLNQIVRAHLSAGGGTDRFKRLVKECLLGLVPDPEADQAAKAVRYDEAFKNHYEPFIRKHEHILENYLVHYVFSNLFPLKNSSPFTHFTELILHYALLKIYLIGLCAFYKETFSPEIVLELVYSFSRNIVHKEKFFSSIIEQLGRLGYLDRAHLSILIKN